MAVSSRRWVWPVKGGDGGRLCSRARKRPRRDRGCCRTGFFAASRCDRQLANAVEKFGPIDAVSGVFAAILQFRRLNTAKPARDGYIVDCNGNQRVRFNPVLSLFFDPAAADGLF